MTDPIKPSHRIVKINPDGKQEGNPDHKGGTVPGNNDDDDNNDNNSNPPSLKEALEEAKKSPFRNKKGDLEFDAMVGLSPEEQAKLLGMLTAAGLLIAGLAGTLIPEPATTAAGLAVLGLFIMPPPPSSAKSFDEGEKELQPSDPLILDLNGDGLKTSSVTDGAFFDLDCSGFAEQTGWASDEDGVLVRDVDNDGWITDGSELFGDKTLLSNGSVATSGFQALADLDSTINGGNFDGKIDANDTAFTELGVIKGGSFFYLEELGIKEISLNYNDISDTIDENGNTLLSKSTYLTEDGRTLEIGEYALDSLSYNTLPLEYDESVDTSTVEHLPEAIGYGNVHNLNYAMAADETGELKALVEEFIYMGPDTENVLTQSERYALAA